MEYVRRVVDSALDVLMQDLPAIALEGAKGVGKTATARQRATTVLSLDNDLTRGIIADNPGAVDDAAGTVFIDEWQFVPSVWNVVRHAVDDGAPPGRFLLAGSAHPRAEARIHSGAGRIVRLMMRPWSLPERGIEQPGVSLAALLAGEAEVRGTTAVSLTGYVDEIFASGFPGIRQSPARSRPRLLESYIARIIDHDIEEMGARVLRPASLREWLNAYGAATATTASYSSLLRAATPGQDDKPSKVTAAIYRDLLQRLWVLDPLPAWVPGFGHFDRLGQSPKLHLVDPALATVTAGVTPESVIRGAGPVVRDGTFLGALFESLAALTVRVLAGPLRAQVHHFRLRGGDREVDIIIERPDHKVLAVEVKLATVVRPADVRDLNWLAEAAPGQIIDKVILNTGSQAYRRPDGIAVVPLALLGA